MGGGDQTHPKMLARAADTGPSIGAVMALIVLQLNTDLRGCCNATMCHSQTVGWVHQFRDGPASGNP